MLTFIFIYFLSPVIAKNFFVADMSIRSGELCVKDILATIC
jgi:hypothetical protein